jgi:hypothetical protein
MNKDINKQLQIVIGIKKYCPFHSMMNEQYKGNECAECLKESEPTLNDVLLAIGKKHEGYKYWIDCNGDVFEFISGGEYTEEIIILHYDIEKSIFNQSDKTKLAILKLLE